VNRSLAITVLGATLAAFAGLAIAVVGGVLGVLPGLIGSIQATEAIKVLTGTGEPLVGRLLLYDALGMSWTELKLRKNPNCPVCGPNPTVTELIDYYEFCGVRGVEDDTGPELERGLTIEVEELKGKMDRREPIVLVDVREPTEYEIARIEGSKLIPLNQLPARVNELSTADEIVVHCHVGGRSARAVEFLREMGFRKVKNLTGGIRAWSDRVDPDVPQY
jgi:adenylyltransferase/sulfurtransferase